MKFLRELMEIIEAQAAFAIDPGPGKETFTAPGVLKTKDLWKHERLARDQRPGQGASMEYKKPGGTYAGKTGEVGVKRDVKPKVQKPFASGTAWKRSWQEDEEEGDDKPRRSC